MSPTYDVVFIGSGINSLVGAALLARAGKRVTILERSDYLGGAIKTAEITKPGFVHEVYASWHPLFVSSPAYQELAPELAARGVEYLNTELPTATALADGSSVFLTTSTDATAAELARHARATRRPTRRRRGTRAHCSGRRERRRARGRCRPRE